MSKALDGPVGGDRATRRPPETALTGRTRYRTGWFGRIVLQVEEMREMYRDEGDRYTMEQVPVWRDARMTDLPLVGER
jgi:hypothetical protein